LPTFEVRDEQKQYETLKTQVQALKQQENETFFNEILFGRDARKVLISDTLAVSNQLLRTKRKTLLKLFQKLKIKKAGK
jgi:hypothetical protein